MIVNQFNFIINAFHHSTSNSIIGSFNWNSDTPTFVFDEQLGNGNEKYTAEAISHKVGHTLGLSHDGRITPSEEYYGGHGSGDTGWASIMGVGYYQNLPSGAKANMLLLIIPKMICKLLRPKTGLATESMILVIQLLLQKH